jgi:hypothetical protein
MVSTMSRAFRRSQQPATAPTTASPVGNGTAPDRRASATARPEAARLAPWLPMVATLCVGVVVLAATVLAARWFDEPIATFTRDVQDYAGVPWYAGAVNTVNIMAWTVLTTLNLTVAWLERTDRRRLVVFGAFTLILLADDAFLLHEAVGPENGIPQVLFLGVYGLMGAALLVGFARAPWTGRSLAFLTGGAFLAISVFTDEFVRGRFLIEDGAKLLGCLVWIAVPLLSLRRPHQPG